MHTLQVAKKSFIVNDTELTDREVAFALRVCALLRIRMSQTFWGYIRSAGMIFCLRSPDEKLLYVRLGLLLPNVSGVVDMELSVFLIDDPYMAEVAAVTALSHIEDLLRMYARETPADQTALYQAAGLVRK